MRKKIFYSIIFIFLCINLVANAQEEIWFAKGEKAYYKKQYEEAVTSFTEAIKRKPDMVDAYYMRGLSFLFLQDAESAEQDFTSVIKLDSNNSDAYNNRGLARSYQQKMESAIIDFQKAIEIDSNFKQAYLNLGSAYLATESYDSGLTCMNKVISLESNNAEHYFIRGTIYYFLKKYNEAIDDFTESLNLGLKVDKTYYNRANSYYKLGKYLEAIDDFSVMLKMNPYDLEALNNRAYAYQKAGLTDKADEDKLRLAEIYTGIEQLTDINKLKFKKFSLKNDAISIELPQEWCFLQDTTKHGGIMIITRDSITASDKNYIAGVRIAYDTLMNEQYGVSSPEEILDFWEANSDSNKSKFKTYKILSKEPIHIGSYKGILKKVEMEFFEDTFAIILYEIVLAKKDKLVYAYFQSPRLRFDYYKTIFDKSLKTFKIKI
jgi:tetratricopeptide (TPR) repeat protein